MKHSHPPGPNLHTPRSHTVSWSGKNRFSKAKHTKVSNKQQHTIYPWILNSYLYFAQLLLHRTPPIKLHSSRRIATVLPTGSRLGFNLLQEMKREIIHLMSHSLQDQGNVCKLNTCVVGMYKHWGWDFPELVGFIAWFTSLSCCCTLCFGWLVSVMVSVAWATISTRKGEIQQTMFVSGTAVQSINYDAVDTKYSTNKRMALCYLSGWFYINST